MQSIKVGDTSGKDLSTQVSADLELAAIREGLGKATMMIDFVHGWSREQFYRQKMAFFEELMPSPFFHWHPRAKDALQQASLNYNSQYTDVHLDSRAKAAANREYERLSKKYPFQKEELPFCFLVSTRNNVRDFKYEYNLKSIYNLDYDPKKIKVVITDDASSDRTADFIQKYLD